MKMHMKKQTTKTEKTSSDIQKLSGIKGRAMLEWYGKRAPKSIEYFPAQEKEVYGDLKAKDWNKIFWGDNKQVLSHLIKEYRGKINFVYIDPPFDSKADYVKKIQLNGKRVEGQGQSVLEEMQYTDIWSKDEYLQFMYERLILIRELLAEDGSIALHCDWHRSAHLKLLLDEVFGDGGPEGKDAGFKAEIIWKINLIGGNAQKFEKNHETIFWYTKGSDFTFNRDPVTVKSDVLEVHKRTFGYYDIVAIIQNKTHLSFAEINKVFEANEVSRDKLVKAVEKNYLIVYSIADQILSQAVKYEKKETIKEETLELTKAFPFKINVKRELHESDDDAFARSLVVYREQEERDGRTSRLGFHINPYNFDSRDELEMFRYLRTHLRDGERVNDVYFTGGVTNEKHNEFFFDYQKNLGDTSSLSKYFPDFLVETSLGRYLVLEVKGGDQELTYNAEKKRLEKGEITKDEITSEPLMKEVGFNEFQELNSNFEYRIIFNGTMLPRQREVVDAVNKL